MTSDNFNQFCKLLSDNFILQTYSAYGVMVDFKRLLKDIKSEIYTELQSGNSDKNLFLGLLINEIDKTDYPKDESKVTVQKWLDKYEITIESIFNEDFLNTTFFKVFEVDTRIQDYYHHYSNNDDEPYYGDAEKLQHDFLFYFRWHFAKELLQFIHSLKDNFEAQKPIKQKTAGFETKYLDKFCFEIQDINSLHRNSFLQCYDNGILPYTDFLKQEVYENLTSLSEKKASHYLNFVLSKISNTSFYNTPPDYFHFDILAFDTKDMPFPYRENKDIYFYISTCYNSRNVDYDHRENMYDLQHKFFSYASMIEAKKIVEFINGIIEERDLASDSDNYKSIVVDNEASDKSIFKKNGETILDALLAQIEINKTNIKKRGNQAKLMAIWHNTDSFRMIFKPYIQKKEYIHYLNKKFVTKISTKSNSDYSNNLQLITDSLEAIKEN